MRRRNRWYILQPVYDTEQLLALIMMCAEYILVHDGDLSTAQWEVSQNYIEYDIYPLVVVYEM